MTPHRLAAFSVLAAALLATASGCRTAGVNDLARRDFLPKIDAESAADLLVEHNRNAGLVESIEARPLVNVSNRRLAGSASGKLALERPRNFKLVLSGPLGAEMADIGSNDREFWFWAKDSPDKSVYFCQYDESGSSPMAVGFQPDWIVEALGLRVIPESEAATIKVEPGLAAGTWRLTQKQKSAKGETVFKETVLSATTKRIMEHRVFASDNKTLLTKAIILAYQGYPIASDSGATPETVYLPRKFLLSWEQEKMHLEIHMKEVEINRFDPSRRGMVFVEPERPGMARKNLAELAGLADHPVAADQPTSVRETMPAPPPRVRLSDPTPLGVEGVELRRGRRDPAMLAADMPPSYARGVEEVIGPMTPTVADPLPQLIRSQSGWRNAVER